MSLLEDIRRLRALPGPSAPTVQSPAGSLSPTGQIVPSTPRAGGGTGRVTRPANVESVRTIPPRNLPGQVATPSPTPAAGGGGGIGGVAPPRPASAMQGPAAGGGGLRAAGRLLGPVGAAFGIAQSPLWAGLDEDMQVMMGTQQPDIPLRQPEGIDFDAMLAEQEARFPQAPDATSQLEAVFAANRRGELSPEEYDAQLAAITGQGQQATRGLQGSVNELRAARPAETTSVAGRTPLDFETGSDLFQATFRGADRNFYGITAGGERVPITEAQIEAHEARNREMFRAMPQGMQTLRTPGGGMAEMPVAPLRQPMTTEQTAAAVQATPGLATDPQGRPIPAGFETRAEAFPEFERQSAARERRAEAAQATSGRAISDRERRGTGEMSMADAMDLTGGDAAAARAMIVQQRQGMDIDPEQQQRMELAQRAADLADTREHRQAITAMANLERMDQQARLDTLKTLSSFIGSDAFIALPEDDPRKDAILDMFYDGWGISAMANNPTGGAANRQIQAIVERVKSGQLTPEEMKEAEEALAELAGANE